MEAPAPAVAVVLVWPVDAGAVVLVEPGAVVDVLVWVAFLSPDEGAPNRELPPVEVAPGPPELDPVPVVPKSPPPLPAVVPGAEVGAED